MSCGNVELRGFEPLTSCMPCLADSSDGVLLGRSRTGFLRRLPGSVRMIHPTHHARRAIRLGAGRQRAYSCPSAGPAAPFRCRCPAENQTATMTWAVPWAYINRPSRRGRRRTAWCPDRGSLARTRTRSRRRARLERPAYVRVRVRSLRRARQSGGGGERSSRSAAEQPRPLAEDVRGRREARPPTREASSCPIMILSRISGTSPRPAGTRINPRHPLGLRERNCATAKVE